MHKAANHNTGKIYSSIPSCEWIKIALVISCDII